MEAFHETLLEQNEDLLERLEHHPFVDSPRGGRLSIELMQRWSEQGYLFIRGYEAFLGALSAKAPMHARTCVSRLLLDMDQALERFQEFMAARIVLNSDMQMGLATRSAVNFLLTTAHYHTFEEGIAVWFAVYVSLLRMGITGSARHSKIQNGASSLFTGLVDEHFSDRLAGLAHCLDRSADRTTPSIRRKMSDSFRIALHYAIRYYDEIAEGPRGSSRLSSREAQ